MIHSFKLRIEPTPTQTSAFVQNCQSARHAYNWALSLHISACDEAKNEAKLNNTKVVYPKAKAAIWDKEYTKYKKSHPWLQECSKWPAQQAFRHLESAFKKFFKKGGYPKFKKYKDAPVLQSARYRLVTIISRFLK